MATKKTPDTAKKPSRERQIIDELAGKAEDFDRRMAQMVADTAVWGDLFKVRPPARKSRTFSNPRRTEFFRACSTIGTLMYRMMTAADPFFFAQPAQMGVNADQLDTLTHTWATQLRVSNYRAGLLKACTYIPCYGTVVVQEDYRVVGVGPFGRRVPVTTFTPRPLDQVMFDRGAVDFNETDWVATSDITSASELMRLAAEVKEVDTPWNVQALEAAAQANEEPNTINPQVLARMLRSGYDQMDALKKRKEIIFYQGRIDAMNDGVEYVAALVNRKYLVRFHANSFQHGRRQFRVAKWVDWDSALGLGLGHLLARQHRSMDGNLQRAVDNIAMASYGMYKRRKNTIADEDMTIRPVQVIDMDDPVSDLLPMNVPVDGAKAALTLDEILKQEFRAASGAVDTLQAMVTGGTASETSLAQNEAMRNISVRAEIASEALVREHLEVMHGNNVQNIRAPLNINKGGRAGMAYPADMRIDVDIYPKITTDKDFKPQRLEKLVQVLQILSSTKSDHPDQLDISIKPIVQEIAYMLDVRPSEVITNPGRSAPVGAGDMAAFGGLPPAPAGAASVRTAGTPVGPVLVSPGGGLQ